MLDDAEQPDPAVLHGGNLGRVGRPHHVGRLRDDVRSLPTGAVAGWGLHPLEKRRLVTAHAESRRSHGTPHLIRITEYYRTGMFLDNSARISRGLTGRPGDGAQRTVKTR
jgi:hypothetical protein